MLRFKHFDPDLTVWEAAGANTYVLRALTADCAEFEGVDVPEGVPDAMRYCREGPDTLVFRGVEADRSGDAPGLVLSYRRLGD